MIITYHYNDIGNNNSKIVLLKIWLVDVPFFRLISKKYMPHYHEYLKEKVEQKIYVLREYCLARLNINKIKLLINGNSSFNVTYQNTGEQTPVLVVHWKEHLFSNIDLVSTSKEMESHFPLTNIYNVSVPIMPKHYAIDNFVIP